LGRPARQGSLFKESDKWLFEKKNNRFPKDAMLGKASLANVAQQEGREPENLTWWGKDRIETKHEKGGRLKVSHPEKLYTCAGGGVSLRQGF